MMPGRSRKANCCRIPVEFVPSKTIAVDVDGTLIIPGGVNRRVVEWCRKKHAEGYSLLLWSAAGRDHARRASDLAGITDLFDCILTKPSVILDDNGWDWVDHTAVLRFVPDE